MTYAIINNRTNETMEHADTFEEALQIKEQYNDMGKSQEDASGYNEYYGSYRIEEEKDQ